MFIQDHASHCELIDIDSIKRITTYGQFEDWVVLGYDKDGTTYELTKSDNLVGTEVAFEVLKQVLKNNNLLIEL